MNCFGHHSCATKHTDPDSFTPITPQPILPDQELLHGKPAASDIKTFVHTGGWLGGLPIGIQGVGSFKKPHQTNNSDKALLLRVTRVLELFSKSFKHLRMLNLKQRKKGHIWVMWFRQPIRFCKSNRETFLLLYRVAKRFLYFKIFSSESLHERVVVSKMIPRTFP